MKSSTIRRRLATGGALAVVAATAAPTAAQASCALCTTMLVSSGESTVDVPEASISVSSPVEKAAVLSGSARVSALQIGIAGGWVLSSTSSFGTPPTHDVADDSGPVDTPTTNRGSFAVSGGNTATVSPGLYRDLRVSSSTLHLEPGVYVVTDRFEASGGSFVDGTDVTIVHTGTKAVISGSSQVLLYDGQLRTNRVETSGSGRLLITGDAGGGFTGGGGGNY